MKGWRCVTKPYLKKLNVVHNFLQKGVEALENAYKVCELLASSEDGDHDEAEETDASQEGEKEEDLLAIYGIELDLIEEYWRLSESVSL